MNKYQKAAYLFKKADGDKLDACVGIAAAVVVKGVIDPEGFAIIATDLNLEDRTVERLIYTGQFYARLVQLDEELAEKAKQVLYRTHFSAIGEKLYRELIDEDEAIDLVKRSIRGTDGRAWRIEELQNHIPKLYRVSDWHGAVKKYRDGLERDVVNAPRPDFDDGRLIRIAKLYIRESDRLLDKRK